MSAPDGSPAGGLPSPGGGFEVRRAADRYLGGDPAAGVTTRHTFSFGEFYDPANTRFGLLLACNEELLAAGAGFAEHTHRDTEIVTWVLAGELEHRDADGTAVTLRPGDAQLLSAGGGVRHVERNPGAEPLVFVQMWLHPDPFGGPPRHTVARDPAGARGPAGPGLHPVASGLPSVPAPLALRQPHAALYLGRGAAELPAAPFRHVQAVRGRVAVGGRLLAPGDTLRVTGGGPLDAVPAEGERGAPEYLVWEMHAEPSYG
ncbi:pirin family protein [Actinacidiphila yeochonensis]|uniref:pirin family protein n=1 Tax=Actinacidiphila yeochonensis TaxID=89050 RepID=UPI0006920A91|nr:pirin family protein [Actinacidiphila yeochonensis]